MAVMYWKSANETSAGLVARGQRAKRYVRATERITRFRALKAGWHFGEGTGPNAAVVRAVERLLVAAYKSGCDLFDVFPGVDGGMLFWCAKGEVEFSVRVNSDLSCLFSVELEGKDDLEVEGLTLEKSIELLEVAAESCLLESFTNIITTKISSVLPLKAFAPHQLTLGSLWSASSAQNVSLAAYVSTSVGTTPSLPIVPQSSGNLILRVSRLPSKSGRTMTRQ